jgi:hypothetical protein
LVEKSKAAEASGEVQLTEFGISGIPVFEVSRFATRALKEGKIVYATLDFAPQLTESELKALMKERFHTYGNDKTCAEALNGFFHKKLNDVLLEIARLSPEKRATSATDAELERLCRVMQAFCVDVTGSKGFDSAQVCAGGVRTDELDAHSLESKLVSGLYFAGEVIDIDGTCGGYNLQWAWSSGVVAARHAAEYILQSHEGGMRL